MEKTIESGNGYPARAKCLSGEAEITERKGQSSANANDGKEALARTIINSLKTEKTIKEEVKQRRRT